MEKKIALWLFLWMVMFVMRPKAEEVQVTIMVTVPANTPEKDPVYITGNHVKLGYWHPSLIEMKKTGGGLYCLSFTARKGMRLEFKFTRGGWGTVEKDTQFREVPNHLLYVKEEQISQYVVQAWGDAGVPTAPVVHSLAGTVKEHQNFKATRLGNERTIWVYLPPKYEATTKRYPVLYVHDGNNVFDKAIAFLGVEWELDETAERLIAKGKIQEIIIVAIANTMGRTEEYTHVRMRYQGGGRADDYAHFIIHEIKPFIDKTYRTLTDRQYTAIMGSSLGGLVSLYIGWKHPDVFSMIGVVSPSIWWGNRDILRLIRNTKPKPPLKIWLDMGTLEGGDDDDDGITNMLTDVRALKKILLNLGFVLHRDLEYMEDKGAEHNEAAWAKRAPKIMEFFFGQRYRFSLWRKTRS